MSRLSSENRRLSGIERGQCPRTVRASKLNLERWKIGIGSEGFRRSRRFECRRALRLQLRVALCNIKSARRGLHLCVTNRWKKTSSDRGNWKGEVKERALIAPCAPIRARKLMGSCHLTFRYFAQQRPQLAYRCRRVFLTATSAPQVKSLIIRPARAARRNVSTRVNLPSERRTNCNCVTHKCIPLASALRFARTYSRQTRPRELRAPARQ